MKRLLPIAMILTLASIAQAAQPATAHELAQSAFESAKKSDLNSAFIRIHQAAMLSTTDNVVLDIAGKLAAWYDTSVYHSQFSKEAREAIEATTIKLIARPAFNQSYKAAANYYGQLAGESLGKTSAPPTPEVAIQPPQPPAPAAPPAPQPAVPLFPNDITYSTGGIPIYPYIPSRGPTIIDLSPTSIHTDPIFTHSGHNQIITAPPSRREPTIINRNPTSIKTDPIFNHSTIPQPAPIPSRNPTIIDNSPTSIHVDPQFQHSK